MSIRMMTPLPARVITVLQDYLPAELDLIDAEEADGITMEDIDSGDYHQWDHPNPPHLPAVTIRSGPSSPEGPPEIAVDTAGMGSQVNSLHRLDVMFHVNANQDVDPKDLQTMLHRYIAGAVRVLCVQKAQLETSADPNAYTDNCLVTWAGEATYGPEEGQEEGALVRTATLPIQVRVHEKRS